MCRLTHYVQIDGIPKCIKAAVVMITALIVQNSNAIIVFTYLAYLLYVFILISFTVIYIFYILISTVCDSTTVLLKLCVRLDSRHIITTNQT